MHELANELPDEPGDPAGERTGKAPANEGETNREDLAGEPYDSSAPLANH